MAGTVDPSVYVACSFGSSWTVSYFALSKPASCVPKIKLLIVKSIINELLHFERDTLTIDTRFTILHFTFLFFLNRGSSYDKDLFHLPRRAQDGATTAWKSRL